MLKQYTVTDVKDTRKYGHGFKRLHLRLTSYILAEYRATMSFLFYWRLQLHLECDTV